MIQRDRAGRFSINCDKCGSVLPLPDAKTHDRAREALTAARWFEAARKGKGRDRWDWWCTACAPKTATSMGRTT